MSFVGSPPLARQRAFVGIALLVALVSIWFSPLAIFAVLLTFLAWVSLPKLPRPTRWAWHSALAFALLCSSIGLVGFVREHALAGMLTASKHNQDKIAISKLREILFAQDRARERAFVDPDGDGIGSALLIGELAGSVALRGQGESKVQLLDKRFQKLQTTSSGAAASLGGYLFIVCLPSGRGFTALPSAPIDDERAEHRFIAYAWPDHTDSTHGTLFSIDEYERIQTFGNRSEDEGASLSYQGIERPPPCDAIDRHRAEFHPWQGKKPRDFLPGYPHQLEPSP
jgi:hypothetical protein